MNEGLRIGAMLDTHSVEEMLTLPSDRPGLMDGL
jgi:hypothetical protein